MTKHIVNVSGGMASAVALLRVIERFGKKDLLAVFADTNGEDADLYRFLNDLKLASGCQIIRLDNSGRTIWDVFFTHKRLRTLNLGCLAARELKQKPLRLFAERHASPTKNLFDEPATIYVGFDADEIIRQDRLRSAIQPWQVEFPLTWHPVLTRCEYATILRTKGVEPPRLYADGYPHNNCAGACILAGAKQWSGLLTDNPSLFLESERKEEQFLALLRSAGGNEFTILKDRRGGEVKSYPLRQLREEIEAGNRVTTDSWRESKCVCMSNLFGDEDQ